MRFQDTTLYCTQFVFYMIKFASCNESFIYDFISTRQKYDADKCLNNILKNNFPCGTLITFVNSDTNLEKLIKDDDGRICYRTNVRSFYADDSDWYIWTKVYMLKANDLHQLQSGLLVLARNVFWNPRATFIVQVDSLDNEEKIHMAFNLFINHNIYNVILLQNLENNAVIHTYYPFRNTNCGTYIEKVAVSTCENTENITYFPENVPSDLNNCSVRVVASDDVPNFISKSSNYTVYGKFVPGLEQFVLDTIAVREGLSIEYEVFNEDEMFYGVVLPNKTATGLLNYLDTKKADVAAGGYSLMKNRVELFDFLHGFNYASYNLFTPTIKSYVWKRLYKEFSLSIWLMIGGALLYVITVSCLLKILLNDTTYSILNTWGYFLGNANAGVSRHPRFRHVILCWSWFTFFIINFYNTALFSLITVHVHETPHSISANNLKTLPYKPCISDNSRMFFQFAYNQSLPEGEPIHNCTFTDGALRYVATTKKYYAIEMEYSYTLKEYEYIDQDGKHDLEPWGFSSSNIIVMYVDRGFRYREIFQKYATRLFESGLIKNHLKTIHLRSYSVMKRHPKAFKNIALVDLGLHFCILLSGYVISFICFLLEIGCYYVTQSEKSKKKKTYKK